MNCTFGGDVMNLIRRTGLLLSVIASVLILTACPSETNVAKINADPGKYRDKEVAIVGRVTDSYGALGNGAYEVDDGTGKIWVITRRGVPSRGAQVGVKGRVHSGINFGGRSYGTVIEETDRSAKSR
jgi:hypothetical protein